MSQPEPLSVIEASKPLANQRNVRLYRATHEAIIDLHKRIQAVTKNPNITQASLIRDAMELGVEQLKERYAPLFKQ